MLYQLGKYNTKQDLSEQSKDIRDQIILKNDFRSTLELINKYEQLEHESILILIKAINAGYWNSIYCFNWNKVDEVLFWKTVYNKSKNQTISKLQYLRSLQSSNKKTVQDLKAAYIQILRNQPSLYYELISEDLHELWKSDIELKIACLNAMFDYLSNDMDLEEFNEEVEFQTKKHFLNAEIPKEIEITINQIRKEKAGNNK